ncbi:MAG: sulfotransferase [Pseudomonadota bacterium]
MPAAPDRPLPDLAIIGCAKSGTTALADALDRRDDVDVAAIKETDHLFYACGGSTELHFRNGRPFRQGRPEAEIVDDAAKYRRQFRAAAPGRVTVDASPLYLMTPGAPDALLALNPDARILLSLRNPSDVAFANFVNHVRDGLETLGIEQAEAALDPARPFDAAELHPFCDHLRLPRYAAHLPAWLEAIPADRRLVLIHEETLADQPAALARVAAFLGLPPQPQAALPQELNVSALPRSRLLRALGDPPPFLRGVIRAATGKRTRTAARRLLQRLNQGEKPRLSPELRARLDAYYAEDRRFVRDLLGRDVPAWP